MTDKMLNIMLFLLIAGGTSWTIAFLINPLETVITTMNFLGVFLIVLAIGVSIWKKETKEARKVVIQENGE